MSKNGQKCVSPDLRRQQTLAWRFRDSRDHGDAGKFGRIVGVDRGGGRLGKRRLETSRKPVDIRKFGRLLASKDISAGAPRRATAPNFPVQTE